ncbi:MAG: NADAR family protein [Hyphomicrobiaceae bacterium]|nr:NADAR family protein [Hyphomicrobiaceae bacterium]
MSKAGTRDDVFNLASLIAEIEAQRTFKYVYFWGDKGPADQAGPFVLSQWRVPASFTLDGITYPTAEHYMMAEKARLFGDEATRAKVLAASSPGAAKALGREVSGFDDAVWEHHRFDIVVAGSTAKFAQNPALRTYLLETGSKVLVEAAPNDTVWGVGLARDDERILDPRTWRGLNLLGFALMKARAALRVA